MKTINISYRQWRASLWLYVVGSMLSAISAGVMAVDFSQTKQVVAFIAGILAVGVLQAKSVMDRTDVDDEVEEPKIGTESTGPR